jgi:2-polyprenyl-3-methyl-5-hydroxy-6-metoxy-1,4-benzoquinol methylase
MFFASLGRRDRQAEVMDQPGLDPLQHRAALHGLSRINLVSGSARILWPEISRIAKERDTPLRVLDVATGGGDVPLRLWKRANRAGLPIHFSGCDISPTALQLARERADHSGGDVEFFHADVLADGVPDGFDIVTCSLFLHHLEEADALELLRKMGHAAKRLVLVNDLARGRFGYLLAAVGARLLTRSRVVHVDGPRSVRAAFTPKEALELANRARLSGATVARRWPCRFLLSWERP